MIKLSKILENNEDLIAKSIEQPSTISNERNNINSYINKIKQNFPNGVQAYEILDHLDNMSENIPYSTQLKILIELAKIKLLNLGVTDYKLSPQEVLKIYANPKDISKNFNLNESPIRITKENEHFLEEGWKENIIALATAAAGIVGSAKGQDALHKIKIPTQIQNIQQSKDTLKLDFGTTFKSGRYTFSKENLEELANKFKQISQFITQHPNANFQINVVASESKVPNYDLENTSPTFKHRLKNGELANKRAEAIKVALSTFENNLRKDGLKFGKINILPAKTLIGGPEWNQGEKANDPKYIQHQYVKIEIIAETPQQSNNVFLAFSSEDESMFNQNRHIVARVFNRTRETQSIKQSGNVDSGHEDVLIRFVNSNTGKFTDENYLLNSSWWNKNRNIDNQMSPELLQKIKQNGKKI